MKPIEFHGHFKKGKLIADGFRDAVRTFAELGDPVVLTIKRHKPKRSTQQNRYYFGVVVDLIYRAINEAGVKISREGTHEMLRLKFLSVDEVINDSGEFITTIRSTTDLTTLEFMEYTEHCVQFAAEYLNVVIPPPGEQLDILTEDC